MQKLLSLLTTLLILPLIAMTEGSPSLNARQACQTSNVAQFNPLAVFKVPPTSGATSTQVAMIQVQTIPHISWGILSTGVGNGGWLFYALQNGAIFPKSSIPFPAPVSVALTNGESPLFVSTQFPPTAFTGFCSSANPAGGPNLLTVQGQNLWSLCPNNTAGGRNDLIWAPVANHAHYSLAACKEVDVQIIPA
ncbi:hypothetical protein ONZ45_g11694 [Pleurotus djamor]|nr:hypothetical protein ONZ45_g11694 [Pleurotus djamor]